MRWIVTFRYDHEERAESFEAKTRQEAISAARRYRASFGIGTAGSFPIVSAVQTELPVEQEHAFLARVESANQCAICEAWYGDSEHAAEYYGRAAAE